MNKHLIIGAAVAGLVLAYAVRKAAGAAVEKVGEAINPLNDNNIFHTGATGLYQYLVDPNGYLGADLWEAKEAVVKKAGEAAAAVGKATDPTADTNLAYRLVNGTWRAVGVLDEHETIGTKAAETVESIENWIKGMF